jgi:hypothetical protein
MRRRALLAAFTALVAGVGAFGVRLVTADAAPITFSHPGEREDAIAAYTDALAWYLNGNAAYAQKSIALIDAWSATIRSHTNSNAPHNRLGIAMTNTQQYTESRRPQGTNNLFVARETLAHAGNPA